MDPIRWFYRDEDDWLAICQRIKLLACPHCNRVGTLNHHGTLRGFDDVSRSKNSIRARRLFCSNRHRRPGCGRTVSVFLAHTLRGTCLHARTLLAFLKRVVASGIAAATQSIQTSVSGRSLQRVWRRFDLAQCRIRTQLLSRGPPPEKSYVSARRPDAAQLIDHLQARFPQSENAIAEYQLATCSYFL